jgi:hypothetical protein
MRLETVSFDTYYRQDSCMFHHEFSDIFLTGIIEDSLWEDESESSSWFYKIEIAFDKEEMTRDVIDIFPCFGVFPKLIFRKCC